MEHTSDGRVKCYNCGKVNTTIVARLNATIVARLNATIVARYLLFGFEIFSIPYGGSAKNSFCIL